MNTKPFLIALALSLALIILGSIAGGLLRSRFENTIDHRNPTWTLLIKLFYLMLFGVMVFSLVPVALHFFLSMQIEIGNGGFMLIRWLVIYEPQVVYGIWGLFVVGLVIAFPAATKGGLLK